jgi:hypothetical protein
MKSYLQFEAVSKEPKSPELNVDALVSAEGATIATQVLESGAVLVALYGKKLNAGSLNKGLSHGEFSSVAKSWIEGFLKAHGDEGALQALLNWFVFVGGPASVITGGKFKDVIHNSIDDYYKAAPSSFEVPAADKANTADAIFISSGTSGKLFSALAEISKLPEAEQWPRATTEKDGKITLLNAKGKAVVSFYQVSLKKEAGAGARIGRATTFFNKNYVGAGGIASPTKAQTSATRLSQEEYELMEGWIGDAVKKFGDIVKGGIKSFTAWAGKKFTSLAKKIAGAVAKGTNKIVQKNKGIKAINNIMVMGGLKEGYLTELADVKITKGMKKDFETVEKELIANDLINKQHKTNIALYQKLNSSYAVKGRTESPIIYAPNDSDGEIDTSAVAKQFGKILKLKEGDMATREDLQLVFKIGMNYSANVAIFALLKSIEKTIGQYENLSQALYAFSATIEAEVKFGNTALPLVIVYGGGDKGKMMVLGTRDEYQKTKGVDLADAGKQLDNFPVLVIKINKSSGGKTYNVIKFYLLSNFADDAGTPVPEWMVFEIQTQSGSSFSTKIEANQVVRKWQ